ncbi:MAG: gliding motility lipoprotein GldH [Prevotella sp.]|nr:gliding motility lipoprotein GldH [Prevotella sp.]
MSRRRISILWGITIIATLIVSCSQLPVYSHFESVGCEGWERTDTLHFHIPLKDAGTYSLLLNLRTNSQYPYTQLVIVSRRRTQTDKFSKTDTLTIDITDEKGNSKGEGLTIQNYSRELPMLTIHHADTLDIDLLSGMHRSPIPGIIDLGITIERQATE